MARSARISILLLLLATACNFPKPPDVPDISDAPTDTPAGCQRDEDCGSPTPACVNNACAVCRTSTSCPLSSPVCDDTSHDCRSCETDSECTSGACNLAAGTCVDKGGVLYVSPGGSAADPCTMSAPCSLLHASEAADTGHEYIVLLPGEYTSGANFNAKTVTIAGNGATIDLATAESTIDIRNGSSIQIRDLHVKNDVQHPGSDFNSIINVIDSTATVTNTQFETSSYDTPGITGVDSTLTLKTSTFSQGYLNVSGRLVMDNCLFRANAYIVVAGSADISNSMINSSDRGGIDISSSDPMHPRSNIFNNTLIAGGVYCTESASGPRQFTSNIFVNSPHIDSSPSCQYDYNLIFPSVDVIGVGNKTGDPLFVDTANNNFHLQPQSPAIDAADPTLLSNGHDFDGISRPQGTRSDIGAFEYVPAP